jgi:hypothetical protein
MPTTHDIFDFAAGKTHYLVFTYQADISGIMPVGGTQVLMMHTTKSLIEVSQDTATRLCQSLKFRQGK